MSQDPTTRCPACGEPIPADTNFCESCGHQLQVPTPDDLTPSTRDEAVPISAPTIRHPVAPVPVERVCASCGGHIGAEGYCEVCGTKAPSERDHFAEQPASWVAGVCDRGIVHARNEDAMALAASATPGERAVLIVCDGVSSSLDADIASLAAARAALTVLALPFPRGLGTPQSRAAAIAQSFTDAAAAANAAIVAATPTDSPSPASATLTVSVVEGGQIFHANIGDSRSYWVPDAGPAVQLTVDDSGAQAQIALGIPREVAENSAQAHAITKWLGDDSPDIVPEVGSFELDGPGWLVTCSDGLWNYASAGDKFGEVLRGVGQADPAALAHGLVEWAKAQGGRDNITVAVARLEPHAQQAPQADTVVSDTAVITPQEPREEAADG